MKLINLNIGIKIDNSEKVGEFIKSLDPDFVAFQEIMRHLDESVFDLYKSKSQIEKILWSKFAYSFFGPLYIAKYFEKNGKITRDFGGEIEQGNEIISQYPILDAINEYYYKSYSYDFDRTNFANEDHTRALQVVEFRINNKKLQILNLHGLHSENKQDSERTIKQSEFILNVAKRKNIPTIIVGDFNLLPNTKSIAMLNNEFRNLITEYKISTTRPDFRDNRDVGNNIVDYIFVNEKIKVNNFEVPHVDISDHFPLILDFEIGE